MRIQDGWWKGRDRDGGERSPQHERQGFGKAQDQTLGEGRRKRETPTGKMTTGLYGPEGREMPFKNSGDCFGVSFLGGRGTWAAGVIIGPCLGPSRGVFGGQMVNSMRTGILSVL